MKLDWKLIGICAAVVMIVFGGYELIQEHDARVKAESVQAAQQAIVADAQKQIDAAKADAAKTASDLNARIAALEAQKQQPVTAAQIAAEVNALLPRDAQPATVIQIPALPAPAAGAPAAATSAKAAPLPDAPGVQIPQQALQALQEYKLDCDENAAKLTACQQTGQDSAAQLAGQAKQLQAVTAERDQWQAAAKGGTFFTRLKGAVKCMGISAGAAAVGSLVDKASPARGAAIGVAAGEVGCRAF